MKTLFSQEQVWEIERYNIAKESREEGQQTEREKSIHDMVALIRDMAADKQVAVQKLMSILGLSQLTAQEKVDLYW